MGEAVEGSPASLRYSVDFNHLVAWFLGLDHQGTHTHNEEAEGWLWPWNRTPGLCIPVRLEWDQLRRGPRHASVHHSCSLRKHEERQCGGRCIWWSAFITGRISCLSVGLNRDSNEACLDCVYLIQSSIYPPRYLLCSVLKPRSLWRVHVEREGWQELRWECTETRSQSAHVKARRCILPENGETDWNFTCTLMWLQSVLKQWTASDQLTLLTMN